MSVKYTRRASVEAAPMQDETILFDPDQNRFCVLNGTAALLWNKMDVPVTTDELSAVLCPEFDDLTADRAANDVAAALQLLQELSLVHTVVPV